MKLLYDELKQQPTLAKAYIHSVEGSIYQLLVDIDGAKTLVWKDNKTPLRCRNLTDMRKLAAALPIQALYLYQESAYDEMLGQQAKTSSNALELSLEPLPKQLIE